MKEIINGIFTWSVYNETKGMNFNGWHASNGNEAVLIDPPQADDETIAQLQKLPRPQAILLTNKHHTRNADDFRNKFDAPVWVHENDAPLMETSYERTYKNGDKLPCGLIAVTFDHHKTPGETAFYSSKGSGLFILGDAVIGKPAGELNMLPSEKYSEPAKAKEALSILLRYDFEALLLGDGESILKGAKTKLEDFLKA